MWNAKFRFLWGGQPRVFVTKFLPNAACRYLWAKQRLPANGVCVWSKYMWVDIFTALLYNKSSIKSVINAFQYAQPIHSHSYPHLFTLTPLQPSIYNIVWMCFFFFFFFSKIYISFKYQTQCQLHHNGGSSLNAPIDNEEKQKSNVKLNWNSGLKKFEHQEKVIGGVWKALGHQKKIQKAFKFYGKSIVWSNMNGKIET